jgi:hypothetical protein
MAEIPSGYGIARLRFMMTGKLNEMITTCGYSIDTLGSPVLAAEAISGYFTGSGHPITAGNMTVGYSYVGCDVTENRGTGPISGTHNELITGTGTGSPMIVNTALIVRKLTIRGGRQGRGRFFFPECFLNEGGVTGRGELDSGSLAILQAAFAQSLVDWLADGFTAPVILHDDGSTPDAITAFGVESICGTQRRRMR